MDKHRTRLEPLLVKVAPAANAQLKRLEAGLASDTFEPPPAESILVSLNPGTLGDRAEEVFGAGARRWELARNLATLSPLTVTWVSLAFATANFTTMIARGGVETDASFLELWERGFDDNTPFPVMKFSHVAYTAAALLVVIALLTLVHHISAQRAAGRARLLRQLLEERVQTLVVAVDTRRSLRQQERLREAFSSAFGSMGDALRAILADTEAQRLRLATLAEHRDMELTKLEEVSSNLHEGTKHLVGYVETMHGLAANLNRATAGLASVAGELVNLRSDLSTSLETFSRQTEEWSDGIVKSWERSQVEQLGRLNAGFEMTMNGMTDRLRGEVVDPILTSPVLAAGAKRIEQLNGAVARLDAVMTDVHRDAGVMRATLTSLASAFGGDLVEAGISVGDLDGAWFEDGH